MKSFEFNHEKNIQLSKREGLPVAGEMIANDIFGHSADVSRLVLKFGNHSKSFVLKDFDQKTNWNDNAKESAVHSLVVWEIIKDLELPTYSTYRLEKNGAAVLMTDLDINGYSALSYNHVGQDWYKEGSIEKKIHEIKNFDDLINQIKICADKTSSIGIVLEPDAYFVLVKVIQPGSYEAKIFIGDFEGVTIPGTQSEQPSTEPDNYLERSQDEIRTQSFKCAARALKYFVKNYIPEKFAQEYLENIRLAFENEI